VGKRHFGSVTRRGSGVHRRRNRGVD
jgi:hypothetical protein